MNIGEEEQAIEVPIPVPPDEIPVAEPPAEPAPEPAEPENVTPLTPVRLRGKSPTSRKPGSRCGAGSSTANASSSGR